MRYPMAMARFFAINKKLCISSKRPRIMPKMSDTELKNIVEAKMNNALGWLGGALSKSRINAVSYYRGDFFGNEQEGRSKVVSRDVAEAIDSMMPSLIKLFASTDQLVIFNPRRPEDEEAANQATDYINWLFQTLPNSFDLLQTWLKSGLLSQIGVVKAWWDDSDEFTTEEYEGLTLFQLKTLLSDDDIELVKVSPDPPDGDMIDPNQAPAAPAPMQPPPQANPGALPQTQANFPQLPLQGSPVSFPAVGSASGQGTAAAPEADNGQYYDCTIRRTNKRGTICVEALPPEEFLTERRAVTLDRDKCFFAAHRSRRTVTDLIEMGYPRDKVLSLPGSDDLDFNQEVINRFRPEDEEPRRDADALEPAMRGVWVGESYLKVDYNGDDVAEWRKVTIAGGGGYELLDNEDADGHPFVAWTPYKSPHKLYGESVADKTMDIQLIKSTVWRQILDGMYFNNAPQLVVQEGQANMEDVLTRRPGGVIRVKTQGAVTPLPVQDSSASGFQMISMLDSIRETRTGVRRFTAGVNADALNPYASTATGANLVEDASQDAIMLIARNFAEMGLKPLFKRMLELVCRYQDKAQTIRLRGKWVNIDPSAWNTQMDMTVTVGLGTGNKDRQVEQIGQMLTQIDQPIAQLQGGLSGPLLTAENVYKKLLKYTNAMGYKEADGFYTDPATAPPQQLKPDPEMVKSQAKIQEIKAQGEVDKQVETIKAQANDHSSQVDAQTRTEADITIARFNAEVNAQIERERMAQEERIKRAEIASRERIEEANRRHDADKALLQYAGQHVVKAALAPKEPAHVN
jgi:hypothetical protein